jgi:SNF2 family DNA or RNA helicase
MKKFVPHGYQTYCISRVISDKALGLFLDMGLGKTIITLTAINDLMYNRFEVRKVLVIAPKKVAERTWSKEAESWEHTRHMRILPVLGAEPRRIRLLNTPADVYVINRENVVWLVNYYKRAWPFDMLIIDESSSFKSHAAKRFRALKAVRPLISRIVELTGTPAPNGLIDLWAQMYLLDNGERLGKTIGAYRDAYFKPDKRDRHTIYTYAPKEFSETAVHEKISDICVSLKAKDWLELPECIEHDIPVVLDAPARRAYDELERELLLQVDEGTVEAKTAGILAGKLLQMCNGAVYGSEKEALNIHDCKIEAFKELIEDLNGSHALVFNSYRHDVPRLKKAIEGFKLRVKELKGAEDIDAWNSGEIDVLIAHPASAGYGLNLQHGGNHVVWFGLTWSLELYQQANKRLHRQGQTEKVIIHRLIVEDGMDEVVAEALQDKAGTQDRLINALKARIKEIKEKGE